MKQKNEQTFMDMGILINWCLIYSLMQYKLVYSVNPQLHRAQHELRQLFMKDPPVMFEASLLTTEPVDCFPPLPLGSLRASPSAAAFAGVLSFHSDSIRRLYW